MSGLFKNFGVARTSGPEGIQVAAANTIRQTEMRRPVLRSVGAIARFPKRPDLTALSESIPLFYIARNSRGFWVARDAGGGGGGIFLSRRSAVRFARNRCAHAGCALMFLNDTLELDTENQGSGLIEPLNNAIDIAWRRAPTVTAFVAMAIEEWRKLAGQVSHAFAGERRNLAAVERELFRGQYTLVSKNDDDLPVP